MAKEETRIVGGTEIPMGEQDAARYDHNQELVTPSQPLRRTYGYRGKNYGPDDATIPRGLAGALGLTSGKIVGKSPLAQAASEKPESDPAREAPEAEGGPDPKDAGDRKGGRGKK